MGGSLARTGRAVCLSEVLDYLHARINQEWTTGTAAILLDYYTLYVIHDLFMDKVVLSWLDKCAVLNRRLHIYNVFFIGIGGLPTDQ